MTEEIENTEVEPEQSIKDTFSFFDVLEGRTYPTDEVTISIDEAAAYDLEKVAREFSKVTDITNEDVEKYQAKLDALKDRIENSKFTFYLQGVPDDLIEDAKDVADERFDKKKKQRKTADGRLEKYLPEEEQMAHVKFFSAVVMALHVTKIYNHKTGAELVAPSPDEVGHFFDKAPGAAKQRLNTAISSLRVESSAYESTMDEGFFPKP